MIDFSDQMANPNEYLPPAPAERMTAPQQPDSEQAVLPPSNLQEKVERVIAQVLARGFVFEPWQIATFITAVRTKPFVILAGISGTGKSKLPRLVADATGAASTVVAVRPDWSDSSELLGYERLDGTFRPGDLLIAARQAQLELDKQFFFVLDEMNIARVEYYLAEVLSRLEDRTLAQTGRASSDPLLPTAQPGGNGENWPSVALPDNLCLVGSVNMDETTYGFSRKVLDRAFVIEFSTVDLTNLGTTDVPLNSQTWPVEDWLPAALSLSQHPEKNSVYVQRIVETLAIINAILEQGQLQFGYRVRDEIAMFCLAARDCSGSFITLEAGTVDPLDIAVAMKVLPRIQGSGLAVRRVLDGLKTWATPTGSPAASKEGITAPVTFPLCARRIDLMLERLRDSGFASYWL